MHVSVCACVCACVCVCVFLHIKGLSIERATSSLFPYKPCLKAVAEETNPVGNKLTYMGNRKMFTNTV